MAALIPHLPLPTSLVKRPDTPPRAIDEKAAKAETGRSLKDWFALVDKSGAAGRSEVGKCLQAAKVDPWWITVITVEHERAKGLVEKDGRPRGYSLCVTKSIAAPVARVYKAFTAPADLDKWFGSRTQFAAEEGGAWKNADGNRGVVKKLRPGKSVVLSWDSPGFAEGSNVEVLLAAKGDKCGIVVNHTRVMSRADADAVRAMWEAGLAALKAMLES